MDCLVVIIVYFSSFECDWPFFSMIYWLRLMVFEHF
jgi:hypothetical protein